MATKLLTITANRRGKIRNESLNGIDYLVAPMTLIVPGVLSGSGGPIFYPLQNIAEDPTIWNNVPLTKNHPTNPDGSFLSARTPEVLRDSLGMVLNSRIENDKLVAEAWFNIDACNRVDSRIIANVKAGIQTELSTGLVAEVLDLKEEGVHNGKTYTRQIGNGLKADHVAILLDEPGACSVDDGCGILNASSDDTNDSPSEESRWIVDRIKQFFGIKNELSHGNVRNRLEAILDEKFGMASGDRWVVDVYKSHFVYFLRGKYYKLDYSIGSGDKLTVGTIPEEVYQKTAYVSVTNESQPGSQEEEKPDMADTPKAEETKEEQVTNEGGCTCGAKKETVTNAAPKESAPKQLTEEEWMAQAPASVRETLTNAREIEQEQKRALVLKCIANVKSDEERKTKAAALMNRSMAELKEIASLIPEAAPEAPKDEFSWVLNGSNAETGKRKTATLTEPPLEVPVMNYSDDIDQD